MLYLITTEQRKKIIDEYQARIWLVSSIALVLLVIIFFILSIPTILAMQSESSVLQSKIEPLETEQQNIQAESSKAGAVVITKNLGLLQSYSYKNVRDIYNDVIEVFEGVSGVSVQSITVDIVTKTVDITCLVRDKDVAKQLVDHIQTTKYTGANLPYNVLSEKASFIFNQKLTYTE